MKITRIETFQAPEFEQVIWVRLHTDEGLIGLGESYLHPDPIRSAISDFLGPQFVLGRDPSRIELLWREMFNRSSYGGWAGAEMRAISAIDIALWDILGQRADQPIYNLLGGAYREKLPIYNTSGPFENFDFNKNADEYARFLFDRGIKAMKIWPFDPFAQKTDGQHISPPDLWQALEPVRKIRNALGNEMDLAMEFHGYWNIDAAVKIAHALEEYEVMWLEDMVRPDNIEALEHLSKATRLPLVVSERLLTRYQFLPVFQRGIARIANPDIEWCGGISEGKKIATLAETFQIPMAFHNYGGPVLNFASAHVAASIPNHKLLETGHHLLRQWTSDIITSPIVIENGYMDLPEGPGLGVALNEDFLKRDDLVRSVVE